MKGKGNMGQLRWYRALGLVAITPILSITLAAQAGDPVAALQQKLNSQFKLTVTSKNLTEIVTAGDIVVLHKNGLKMSALASPLTESSTYKDGKIGGGGAKRFWGSLGVAALQGVAAGLDPSAAPAPADIPAQTYGSGQKFWVLGTIAQKDGVLFKLYSDPDDNGVRYHADLKVLYPNKKQVPSADAALQLISEVLTVVPQDDQNAQQATDPALAAAPSFPQGGPPTTVSGTYFLKEKGAELNFDSETTAVLQMGSVQTRGSYTLSGEWLTLRLDGNGFLYKIQPDRLVAANGEVWIRQGGGLPPASDTAFASGSTQTAFAAQHKYDDLAAPQPPPAPAPTISTGQTRDQVIAAFGEPQRKAAVGPKEIYFYPDLKIKVTFINRKVSSIE
jgi:hypothetical protein